MKQTKNIIKNDLPVMAFENAFELRSWLKISHTKSEGIWLKIYKKKMMPAVLAALKL